MRDFFPLVKGAVREYATERSTGKGTLKIEVLSVETAGAITTAKCRRVENGKTTEFTVVKDEGGVREGTDIEFNHPLKAGTEWLSPPRRFWIEALDAAVTTPAGTFKGCLRVAYLIAEGDGGSGERHYAPGVGLVKVVENDEAAPFTVELTSRRP